VLLGRRATFRVTPKTRGVGGRFAGARLLRIELLVAAITTAFGLFVLGSVMPLLALIGPSIAALYLHALASRPAPEELLATRPIPGSTVRRPDTVGV
jgi:hypothetical protein